jgi:hypothetical protein
VKPILSFDSDNARINNFKSFTLESTKYHSDPDTGICSRSIICSIEVRIRNYDIR